MPANGKTTAGRHVEALTGLPLIDKDDLLENCSARVQRSIPTNSHA